MPAYCIVRLFRAVSGSQWVAAWFDIGTRECLGSDGKEGVLSFTGTRTVSAAEGSRLYLFSLLLTNCLMPGFNVHLF